MKIFEIELKNFKSYFCTSINFDPKLNIILGENNLGKTSLFYSLKRMTNFIDNLEVVGLKQISKLFDKSDWFNENIENDLVIKTNLNNIKFSTNL